MADSSDKLIKALQEENAKLRTALSELICWAGEPAKGPAWAAPEAQVRNQAMCERAIQRACALFPDDWNIERSKMQNDEVASNALQSAARCWCDPRVSNRTFDPVLAEVFAELLAKRDELITDAWGIIANSHGGDWNTASPMWQKAATRWRDTFHEKPHDGQANDSAEKVVKP